MSPAEYVTALFGGVRPLARVLKISPANIIYWRKKTSVSPGGLIPSKYHTQLMEEAHIRNLKLSTENLIYGGDLDSKTEGLSA